MVKLRYVAAYSAGAGTVLGAQWATYLYLVRKSRKGWTLPRHEPV